MANLLRCYRHSGLVMYFSTLPAPSASAPCILAILTHLRVRVKICILTHPHPILFTIDFGQQGKSCAISVQSLPYCPNCSFAVPTGIRRSKQIYMQATVRPAMTMLTIDISLMRMLRLGPEVSLKGSPTVSPTMVAL